MKKRTNYLLAIGIDNYTSGEWDNLNNAVGDTKAVVEILTTRYSFEMIQPPLYNDQATKENILQAFTLSIPLLTEEDNLIIYYGGHGFMHPLTMKGYWVPSEARKNQADFISNSDIKDILENMPAKHIFLIADACFSGTFLSRTRGNPFEESYSTLDDKVSRWMLASGGEESVSDGPAGKGSPFAQYLLKFLTENSNQFVSVVEMIRYVSTLTSHHSKQQPQGAQIESIGHNNGQMILELREDLVKTNLDKTAGEPNTQSLRQEMRSVYRRRTQLSAGKEILLVDSFVTPGELLICECFRFDDNGAKKIEYQGNRALMPAKEDPNFFMTLHGRFATWEGLTRFLDENKLKYEGIKTTIIHAAEEIDHVEETEAVIHQQGIIQDMMDANPEPMRCLHCNSMITSNDNLLVEIDEKGLKANVGNIHNSCRRPADRVLGKTMYENPDSSNLVNFDAKKWLELLDGGQAFLHKAKKATEQRKISIISWNKQHSFNMGDYCIKMSLEGGDTAYVRLGKSIHRFNESEIDQELADFNKFVNDAEKAGDPLGMTSKSKTFGSSSHLLRGLVEGEKIRKVLGCEKEKYSQQFDSIDTTIKNDYIPLGIPMYPGSHGFIMLNDCIPLISDPTQFDKMHKNWNDAGFQLGECSIKIIESDQEFDLYMSSFFEDGVQPVIDPLFNTDKKLIEGIYVKNIEQLKEQAKAKSYTLNADGIWKAGDRVKVVFPGVKTNNFARGVLLTDEFTDENGEQSAIFRPIEDGAVREDMQFKMPTKLFVKD